MQIREESGIASDRACTECGLRGDPPCAQMWDGLLARDFEQPARYWRWHRLAVDTYSLQHEPYVKSAKSLAAHLCGVCIAFEHRNDAALLAHVQRWLSTNPSIAQPVLPAFRGALTVAHIHGVDDPVEYGRRVEEWSRSSWEAYRDLQPFARGWIAAVVQLSRP